MKIKREKRISKFQLVLVTLWVFTAFMMGCSGGEVNQKPAENSGTATVAFDLRKYSIFGKQFSKWNYDSLIAYMKACEFQQQDSGEYTIYIQEDASGNTLANVTVKGYSDLTNANELVIESGGLNFTLYDRSDENILTWVVMRPGYTTTADTGHALADYLGIPLETFVDFSCGDGAFEKGLTELGQVQVIENGYYMVSAENNATISFEGQSCGFTADSKGNINTLAYVVMDTQGSTQKVKEGEIFDNETINQAIYDIYDFNGNDIMLQPWVRLDFYIDGIFLHLQTITDYSFEEDLYANGWEDNGTEGTIKKYKKVLNEYYTEYITVDIRDGVCYEFSFTNYTDFYIGGITDHTQRTSVHDTWDKPDYYCEDGMDVVDYYVHPTGRYWVEFWYEGAFSCRDVNDAYVTTVKLKYSEENFHEKVLDFLMPNVKKLKRFYE